MESVIVAPTESERMLNLGVTVELKSLGRAQVKELTLEDTIALARELSVVFGSIDTKLVEGERGLEWFMSLLSDPLTQQALRSLVAASTNREPDDFINLGISDWLKLLAAFKTVVDWDEMKELFFQIIPLDTVKSWTENLQK